MCFGPYTLGMAIPAPFRSLGGNCVVTSFPLYKASCDQSIAAESNSTGAVTQELPSWMTDMAEQGSCTNPPQIGQTKILSNQLLVNVSTISSAFRMVAQ